jgi:hypothetical protein
MMPSNTEKGNFPYSLCSYANLCGNTLTDIPSNNVLLAIWASYSQVKLTQKINHPRNVILKTATIFPIKNIRSALHHFTMYTYIKTSCDPYK